jgi:hypothetical protein
MDTASFTHASDLFRLHCERLARPSRGGIVDRFPQPSRQLVELVAAGADEHRHRRRHDWRPKAFEGWLWTVCDDERGKEHGGGAERHDDARDADGPPPRPLIRRDRRGDGQFDLDLVRVRAALSGSRLIVLRRGDRGPGIARGVVPGGQVDPQLLLVRRIGVVLTQSFSDLPGGHSNDRIGRRVVPRLPAEDGAADAPLFQGLVERNERVLDHVFEELAAALARAKSGALAQPPHLFTDRSGLVGVNRTRVPGRGLILEGLPGDGHRWRQSTTGVSTIRRRCLRRIYGRKEP